MERLNITEYNVGLDEYQMYYGKASLRGGYYVANYDERFFHLLGMKGFLSFPEMIHPEDAGAFMEAAAKLEEGPQHLIVRIMCYNDRYRYFYMVMKLNGKILDGFRSFDIELCEIMSIKDKYMQYVGLVDKYREIMSLSPGMFLEYDLNTDQLLIYEYNNRQSRTVFQNSLEETNQKVIRRTDLNLEQKADFQILYEALKKGRNHLKVDIDAAVLLERAEQVQYEIRLSTIYRDDIRDKSVGLVTVKKGEQPRKSYYLSDSAFDPGTGLLNKRAINEYAVEKIQNQTKGLYLAIIDVDDFKRINDSFGHMFGDEVLLKVSEIIRSVVKIRGIAGRFGGDEFMVVLEGIDSEDTLRRILSTIARNVEWAFNDVEGLKITVSIGISQYGKDGTTYEELFQKADKCVYIAKAKGKNRYIIYNEARHGAVIGTDSSRMNIGLKATISEDKKNEAVSDFILQLYREGEKAFIPIMKQMQSYFDIDGIALYAGTDMKRIYSVGKYENPIQNLMFACERGYQEFFDEQGFYQENKPIRLKYKCPEAYEMFTKQENGKLIQCAVFQNGVPMSVVSFDFFNRAPKTGTSDLGLIKIVGRMMAEIAAGLKHCVMRISADNRLNIQ